jgi:hypothetical protein
MHKLFENSYDEASEIKDGGFVFQTILSYDMRWSIVDGESKYDQRWVEGKLHQVDIYPDMKFMEGYATLNYVILSEVNLFKRKLDLATEYIKMAFSKGYADEINGLVAQQQQQKEPIIGGIPEIVPPEQDEFANIDFTEALRKAEEERNKNQSGSDASVAGELSNSQKMLPGAKNEADSSNLPATTDSSGLPAKVEGPGLPSIIDQGKEENTEETEETEPNQEETEPKPTNVPLTAEQKKAINDKYFKGTSIKITFEAKRVVLREISTSSVDSGRPTCTLKLSTGMVDTLDGQPINSWNGFKIYASGAPFDGMVIDNETSPPISKAIMYDPIDNANDLIFRTILPSIYLEFSGDSVKIDTYNNRSAQVGFKTEIDFDDIFKEKESTPIIEPEEGEEGDESDQEEEDTDTSVKNPPSGIKEGE